MSISVRCSTGTYVRSIARDLGAVLGVGGHLTALRRTAVGPFVLAEARTLEQLEERWAPLDLAEVARRCFPVHELDEQGVVDVGFGRRLSVELPGAGPVALFSPAGEFLALYEQRGPLACAVAVLAG